MGHSVSLSAGTPELAYDERRAIPVRAAAEAVTGALLAAGLDLVEGDADEVIAGETVELVAQNNRLHVEVIFVMNAEGVAAVEMEATADGEGPDTAAVSAYSAVLHVLLTAAASLDGTVWDGDTRGPITSGTVAAAAQAL